MGHSVTWPAATKCNVHVPTFISFAVVNISSSLVPKDEIKVESSVLLLTGQMFTAYDKITPCLQHALQYHTYDSHTLFKAHHNVTLVQSHCVYNTHHKITLSTIIPCLQHITISHLYDNHTVFTTRITKSHLR